MSTLEAMEQELVSDSFVRRYVGALAQSGRLGPAGYAFDKMLTYAHHVGLFAEEVGPTGEQLGNVPQAFTHPALITAARSLDRQVDAVH